MKHYGHNLVLSYYVTALFFFFFFLVAILLIDVVNQRRSVYAQETLYSPIPLDDVPTPTLTPSTSLRTSPTPSVTATSVPTIPSSPIPSAIQAPTQIPTPTPTPVTAQSSTVNVSQNLNLVNWKLTLPTGDSKKPREILQPELNNFSLDPWFISVSGGTRFRAPVNGVTTSNSGYPRSELREMTDGGKNRASWSTSSGVHTMYIDQAITAVPQNKQHVVAGQIHDSDDDVIVIRLEMPNLYVNVDGKNLYTLDNGYTLGKRFNVKFEASNGQTKVFYNGSADSVYTLNQDYSGAYFKAGAYIQSNCSKESVCSESNYGEVIIYQLSVSHQ